MENIYKIIDLIDFDKVILYTLFASTGVQVFYYLFFYLRVLFKGKAKEPDKYLPLSVIVCAKNEAINVEKYIVKLVEQDYPVFEVIVVDDCSSDDTPYALIRLAQKYPNRVRFTTLVEDPKFKHGKKLALTVGIKSAKYDHVVLIDADCYPTSDQWLKQINQQFSDTTQIVLGYGGFIQRKGLLDKFIRYDAITIAQNYLSFAKAHIPYMGVGRNLAYKKSLFFDNKGFASHYGLNSGDDDLFVREVANKHNTKVMLTKESITRTPQKTSFREWYIQKKRHLTTSPRYNFGHKLLLGLEPLSRVLFYCSVITFFTYQVDFDLYTMLAIAGGKEILQLFVFKMTMRQLCEKNLLLYSLVLDALQPIFYGLLTISNLCNQKKR